MGFGGRDVEVVALGREEYLVMACDSAGAIGEKSNDVINVPPYLTGRLTTRVALLEVLTTGAQPKMLSLTVSNEPEPTGEQMLLGLSEELDAMGLSEAKEHISVSTEKNFETSQTGCGVTVVGTCCSEKLRIGKSTAGDRVYVFGFPKVGNEIQSFGDPEIIQGGQVVELMKLTQVHDLIPVGSKGILGELMLLCEHVECSFLCSNNVELDLKKSAGPSTCLLVTSASAIPEEWSHIIPVRQIGTLVS